MILIIIIVMNAWMDGFGLDIFEITKNYGKCIPCQKKKKKKIVNLVLKIILDTRCDSCND